MARSMTGFARIETSGPWGKLAWEARSVNHRYLDVRVRLPDVVRAIEPRVRETVASQLSRGKVELSLRLESDTATQAIDVDSVRLDKLAEALDGIRAAVPDCRSPDSLQLLQYPGIQHERQPDAEAIEQAAMASLLAAVADLQQMRVEEGERLAEILRDRAAKIAEHARGAADRLPQVQRAWRRRLHERLDELDVEADPARVEQELVFTAQRMDVAEELDRLHSHIASLEDALALEEPIGRRLDFLMQEFNREANTVSSKSQDTELTNHAVEMKVLIEQMREQVQNIE